MTSFQEFIENISHYKHHAFYLSLNILMAVTSQQNEFKSLIKILLALI